MRAINFCTYCLKHASMHPPRRCNVWLNYRFFHTVIRLKVKIKVLIAPRIITTRSAAQIYRMQNYQTQTVLMIAYSSLSIWDLIKRYACRCAYAEQLVASGLFFVWKRDRERSWNDHYFRFLIVVFSL